MKYDFSGWATRNNIRCSDGRTIMKDAFKHNDGKTVPLVWNHCHDTPDNILGHALLENREDGVYAYCSFNESENAKAAKVLLEHGDISSLSILANGLRQQRGNVEHGEIREVSLVLAGANPGAYIDSISHGDDIDSDEEAVIYSVSEELQHSSIDITPGDTVISHSDDGKKEGAATDKKDSDKTVKEVVDSMTDEQRAVMNAIVGIALSNSDEEDDEGGNDDMKHNVFDCGEEMSGNVLSHSAINFSKGDGGSELIHTAMSAIITDAKRYGSMKESFLAHSAEYGIENIEYLFPDAKTITNAPVFIKRDTGWVGDFLGKTHNTPFSKIKSIFANITEDEARAKGYIKGNKKKDEVFTLLKRTTESTTIYKKQRFERDDLVDITDFDVVAFVKTEMRWMLDEERARAALIGDGRLSSSDDKIPEDHIRPIALDDDLFTIKVVVPGKTPEQAASDFIEAVIRSRKNYKGSGSPVLYTTEDMLTSMLLLKDGMGRDLYEDESKLSKKLRVSRIVTVPVMEGAKGKKGGALLGIIVNPADYNFGADKGGAVNMFDDFDIDYNQQKYLIETRCSGALTLPYSAIALELGAVASSSEGDAQTGTTGGE